MNTTTKDFGKFTQFNGAGRNPDQELAPIFRGDKNPIPVPVEFRNTTAVVGDPNKQYIRVGSPAACKAILSAADKLTRGRIYPHVEVGLHLRYTLAELKRVAVDGNVGVISFEYASKGDLDKFAPFVPEDGYVKLGVNFGVLTGYKMSFAPFDEANPKAFRSHDYNSIKLHMMMDALLAGTSYHLQPNFRKEVKEVDDDNPTLPLVERQAAFIAKWSGIWAMTDEEAEVSYRENALAKSVWQSSGKTAAALAQAEADGLIVEAIATIPLKDGGAASLEDLNGKTIRRWYGVARVGGTIVITPENWRKEAQVIIDRGLVVQVI
jgi:hypothetical protein